MQRIVSGGISFAFAGIWWFIDKLWGDAIFASLRPMIPEWAANPPVWTLIDWSISIGPPLILVVLGSYFIFSGQQQTKRASADVSARTRDLTRDLQEGKWEFKYPPIKTSVPDWPIRELFARI